MAQKFGTTFSQPHLQHLGISIESALATAFSLKLDHLRIGAYWNTIQTDPNTFNFDPLTHILTQCQTAGQSVVLTIGVKAPRWPEFFWPSHVEVQSTDNPETQQKILTFIRTSVTALQKFSCITHWQVENEPLDPSGPAAISISNSFLSEEVALVRSIDSRPIIITLWGNELVKRNFLTTALQLADIVGIDLYYKQFVTQLAGKSFYTGPSQSHSTLAKALAQSSKPIWITELQAEPWEKDEATYLSSNTQSISPSLLEKNLKQAVQLPVTEILFWGFEYWMWKNQQGDNSYLKYIRENSHNV